MPQAKEGMKLSTFLSQALKNPAFDVEYSKIMECAKVKGQIVISIDPLDFILMSFNQSGWNSCHTIAHNGESRNYGQYVAGIFSYIADPTTMISYRHSNKLVEYHLGRSKFQEYSKNWRELIYIDTNTYTFCASRQYPRSDETISKSVRLLLEEIISNKLKVENMWKTIRIAGEDEASEYIDNAEFDDDVLHYNDMLNGYEGKIVYNKQLDNVEATHIIVGNNAICPVCGENYITDCSHPMCEDCYETI